MTAIRQFIDVKNNSFKITLPEEFKAQKVEVIIMPFETENEILTWQKDTVLQRIEAIKQNPELLIDEKEFWKELENEI